jgi:hypothetical protein
MIALIIVAVMGWLLAAAMWVRANGEQDRADKAEADCDALDSIRLAEVDRRRRVEAAVHGGDPAVWAGLRATERELGRLR